MKNNIIPRREEIMERILIIKKDMEQHCGRNGLEFNEQNFNNLNEDEKFYLGWEHNFYLIRDGEEKAAEMTNKWLEEFEPHNRVLLQERAFLGLK